MKRVIAFSALVALCLSTTVCSKGNEKEASEPTRTVQIETESVAEGEARDAAGLVGTKWLVGDMLVTFRDESNLFVEGGEVEEVAPSGLLCAYTVEDGIIEVDAMGEIRRGTWDGEKLIVDGQPAKQIQ